MPTFLFVCQAMCAFYYEIILFEPTYVENIREPTYVELMREPTYVELMREPTYLRTYERHYLFGN